MIAGALAPTLEPVGSQYGTNDLDYLRELYTWGMKDSFDALAVHTYGFKFPPEELPDPAVLDFREWSFCGRSWLRMEMRRNLSILLNQDGNVTTTMDEGSGPPTIDTHWMPSVMRKLTGRGYPRLCVLQKLPLPRAYIQLPGLLHSGISRLRSQADL